MDLKDIEIPSLGMSVRTTNALMREEVYTANLLAAMTESELRKIRNMGEKSVTEALEMIEKLKLEGMDEQDKSQLVCDYLQKCGTKIDVLEFLPARAKNILLLAGYEYLYQIVYMTADQIALIQDMDVDTAAFIEKLCGYYLQEHHEEIADGIRDMHSAKEEKQTAEKTMSYQDAILDLARDNDISIEMMMMSKRATGCLLRAGFSKRSEILFETPQSLGKIKNMGKTSIEEVMGIIGEYRSNLQKQISEGTTAAESDAIKTISDDDIRREVLNIYKEKRFGGYSFREFKEKLRLPECVADEQLKRVIGRLLAEHELEYVDFRCYRVYPTLREIIETSDDAKLSEREKMILENRLQGKTLEEVGKMLYLTRERVRQLYKKALEKCQKRVAVKGLVLDEKYYLALYENYELDKGIALEWLGIPIQTWQYLNMVCDKKGTRPLDEAISDQQLDVSLRLKIQNYLNRNKIFIDGVWIEKKRGAIEDYVLSKFCRDVVAFDEFVSIYNGFLEQQGIEFDEKLYLTPEVERTRENKLDAARNVLCSFGHRIRYYDIDSRDYTELLDELMLPLYVNTELSTLKFTDDYPEIMRRYDIRNHYELHNLLRKILPEGGENDMKFGFMPMIGFGTFNRAEMVIQLMQDNAPISWDGFMALARAEFGYEQGAIPQGELMTYYHNGTFSVDYKEMSAEHMTALKHVLTEDFYYLDEIRKIYAELFPAADQEEINPFNLKRMGFKIFSRYALQHYSTADAYFRQLLTAQDVTDITPYRKRYGYKQAFNVVLYDLKSKYTVLEYDVNQLISINSLEKYGFDRTALHRFCDAVYDFVKTGEFFTMQSIRLAGFESELDSLCFGDWFLANILINDPRFSYCRACWSFVFCKGERNFTVQDLYTDMIEKEGWVDIHDMLSVLSDTYGFNIKMNSDITVKLKGSNVYYDSIRGRLYASEELYQRSLDQEAG